MQRALLNRTALRFATPNVRRAPLNCRAMAGVAPVHGTEEAAKQHIKVGAPLPNDAKFQVIEEDGKMPVDVPISKVLAGKKAVIFGLPGAFTSVCSSKHVPQYNAKADELKSKGVDVIACISVNDAFVMREWAKNLGVDPSKVAMLADGDASFTKAIGLAQTMPGMGERSLRYSAYVDNLVVKHLNIEEPGGGSYKVSGPDHMLEDLSKLKA